MTLWGRLRILLLATALASSAGCEKDDVQVYRAPKETPSASLPGGPAPGPGGMPLLSGPMGDNSDQGGGQSETSAVQPMGSGAEALDTDLAWKAPSSWKEQPASGMRRASFIVGGKDGADMSVVTFPGEAGGTLANVNRWRGQLGLGPWNDADLSRRARFITAEAGKILWIDIAGAGKRLLGGILTVNGNTWFFKLNGPEAVVESARPSFMEFLRSVHRASRAT